MMGIRTLGVLLAVSLLLPASGIAAMSSGRGGERPPAQISVGFKTDFSKHSVPYREFQSGGPGKDGIPAIDHPRFTPVSRIDFLKPQEPVIELVVRGKAKAYPLQILIWHEIVNDFLGGEPVAVTFCPLCNTAIVFAARVDGKRLSFGTTGNLRDSDLVFYDRTTESWWQQFGGEAVVGALTGKRLRQLPARIVAWSAFERSHPDGLVLTRNTGFSRPYGQNPYVGYDDASSPPFFPAKNLNDRRLPPKERVVFVQLGSSSAVVPFSLLAKRKVVRVTVAGHKLVVRFTGEAASALDSGDITSGRRVGTAEVTENGKLVPFSEPFWFAVAALRPTVVVTK